VKISEIKIKNKEKRKVRPQDIVLGSWRLSKNSRYKISKPLGVLSNKSYQQTKEKELI